MIWMKQGGTDKCNGAEANQIVASHLSVLNFAAISIYGQTKRYPFLRGIGEPISTKIKSKAAWQTVGVASKDSKRTN